MAIDDGGPAFARPAGQWDGEHYPGNEDRRGMSLRAHIATQCAAAIIGLGDLGHNERTIALASVAQADALIAALKE